MFTSPYQGGECDPLDQYQCKEGVCISIEKVCDGVMDCMFEDDEFDCTEGKIVDDGGWLFDKDMQYISEKIGKYSYTYEDEADTVVYDTEYDQVDDGEDDWSFGFWK